MPLTYSLAPHDWAICFQDDCPMKDTCLRRAVARLAPPTLTCHITVLPTARQGDHCPHFATAEPVKIARGMTRLLPRAPQGELSDLREALYALFGSVSHFYRYREGRYPITPQQQRRVEELFRSHGIEKAPVYDQVNSEYYFPEP